MKRNEIISKIKTNLEEKRFDFNNNDNIIDYVRTSIENFTPLSVEDIL